MHPLTTHKKLYVVSIKNKYYDPRIADRRFGEGEKEGLLHAMDLDLEKTNDMREIRQASFACI